MNIKTCFIFLSLIPLLITSCTQNNEPSTTQITICPTNGQWCQSTANKNKISILFPKKIPYLKPFPIQVKIQNKGKSPIQSLHVEFSMQGMEMGVNRFNLKLKQGISNKQQWETNVVLPICASGKKDWLAKLTVKSSISDTVHYFLITII